MRMQTTQRIGAVLILLVAPIVLSAAYAGDVPSAARRHDLISLLRQDCGSCHGMSLHGGLGPALTPQALAGKSPEMLRATILNGRAGTPMAPWRPFLTESEALWLVQQLQQGFPDAP
jgi:cytochrome c55X